MKLVGMLDSPYVRRVAICLDALGVPFQHEAVSVFSTFERFQKINPVVKAPTLICDDGGILMDSTLILQYIEHSRFGGRSSLWSHDARLLLRQFRAVSYALAGCDKTAQYVYETNLRPAQAQHAPWKTRVMGQLRAAFAALETQAATEPKVFEKGLNHASICAGVVWQFAQSQLAAEVPADKHPTLVALSARLEQLPIFLRYPPTGPGVPGLPAN